MLWRGGACRSLVRLGIAPATLKSVGSFSTDHRRKLDFRCEHVSLEARLNT